MNVRVNLNYTIYDGAEIVFKAPCNASEVTGLIVYYPVGTEVVSSVFTFADAHTNDLGNIDDLFAKGAVVKVIIDTETNMAFVQNAATNAYLESRFAGILAPYYVDVETQGSKLVIVSFDWAEVLRQINSGNSVVCRLTQNDVVQYLPLSSKIITEYESFIMFSAINDDWYYEVKIYPDGTIFDTASPIEAGGTDSGHRYYYTITNALEDIKAGNDIYSTNNIAGAVVMVDTSNGQTKLILLQDVVLEEQLAIDTNVELILNGHSMSMSYAGDNIVFIDGTKDGSEIRVTAATNPTEKAALCRAKGALHVKGGRYIVKGAIITTVVFGGTESCPELLFEDCTIELDQNADLDDDKNADLDNTHNESAIAAGIQSLQSLTMRNVDLTVYGRRQTDAVKCKGKAVLFNSILTAESKTGQCYGIHILNALSPDGKPTGTTIIDGIQVSATTLVDQYQDKGSCGILNLDGGECTVENSIVLADACSEKSVYTTSTGISNYGTMICRNIQSLSTHSGIQNKGHLQVERCLLSGVSHGGLYTYHDNTKNVVINDTILEVGVYRGQAFVSEFTDLFGNSPSTGYKDTLAAMYFGASGFKENGGNLYMDGCIFTGRALESIVVRPTGINDYGTIKEDVPINQLFISRSKIAVQLCLEDSVWGEIAPIRVNIAGNYVVTEERSKITIGSGCNFTEENVFWSDTKKYIETKDELYRKESYRLPTYEDYYAMNCDNVQLGDVSKALDKVIEIQEELIG